MYKLLLPLSFCTGLFTLTACSSLMSSDTPRIGRAADGKALVIAHRGASASRPEHTLAAYRTAIEMGADVIEPDLVSTRDGVLVARHENEIGGTTNVAQRAEFANRKTTKNIDGTTVTGWFTEDFTLAELKTLRAVERIPNNRPVNSAYDGQSPIPTLDEIIELVKAHQAKTGKVVAIYPETKHPSYFRNLGLPLEEKLVKALHNAGWRGKQAPVYIQSFEVANLKYLRTLTDLPIVQLLDQAAKQPWDFVITKDRRTYGELASPAELRKIALYADAIGPYKEHIIQRDAANQLGKPTTLVADAHAAGLAVHIWTLRPENPFLPNNLRRGDVASLSERGDLISEIRAYLAAGVDGFFTDAPELGVEAVRGNK